MAAELQVRAPMSRSGKGHAPDAGVPCSDAGAPALQRRQRYERFVETGDWTEWIETDVWPTFGAEAVEWIETWAVFGDGPRFGEPAELLPEWELLLWEWFEYRPGPAGEFVEWRWKDAIWGFPKGVGKSQVVAWLAILCTFGPWPIAPKGAVTRIAAASFEQAKEVFGNVQVACGGQGDIHPEHPLHGQFLVQDAQVLRSDGTPGRIERVAAAAGTTEGSKLSTLIVDEVHEFSSTRKQTFYTVNVNALAKRPDARAISISTAGVRGSTPPKDGDPLLWKIYGAGKAGQLGARTLFRWREASDSWDLDDPAQLRSAIRDAAGSAADRLFSVEDRAARYKAADTTVQDFRRRFLNQWVRIADDSWLKDHPTAWSKCSADINIPDGAQVVVGVDGARRLDCFAVVVAWKAPDGRHVWRSTVWQTEAPGEVIDHSAVRDHIVDLNERYWIVELVFDPSLLQLMAQDLERDHEIPITEVPQSTHRRAKIDQHAFELIVGGRIAHDGDPVLEEHVLNAAWRHSENVAVLSKGRSGGKIDALIAGAMASWALDTYDPEPELEQRPEPHLIVL